MRQVSRPLAGWLALLVVAGACSSPTSSEERLAQAFADTFSSELTYTFAVEADRAALDALGEGAAAAARFLSSFRVDGIVQGERGASLNVRIGQQPVLELRTVEGQGTYVRLGLRSLLALTGQPEPPPASTLAPTLAALGLSQPAREFIVAALDGEWVGVTGSTGPLGIAALLGESPAAGDEGAVARVEAALGGSVAGFVRTFVRVDGARPVEGGTTYDVSLRLRDLLRALAGIDPGGGAELAPDAFAQDLRTYPETVPGTVDVRDGVVTRVALDVAAAVRSTGDDVPGVVSLVLAFDDHGAAPAVQPPDDAVVIDGETFAEAVSAFAGLLSSG